MPLQPLTFGEVLMLWFETFPSLVEAERRCNTTFLSVVNGCGAAFALALHLCHCVLILLYNNGDTYFMAHSYGALPYGLLHRDILQIAVEHDFSKIMHLLYNWMLVNANPFTAEIYGNPTVVEVAELFKTNKQSLYNMRDAFVDLKMIKQEVGVHGLKCIVEHVKMARAEIRARDAIYDDDFMHPYANLIAGKIPREFVRIAAEEKLGKSPQRHFWYISLNLAPAGHLTRLDEIEDIGKIIGTNSTVTMLRSFKNLERTGLFSVKGSSTIQGTCEPVVAAMEEAAEQRRKRQQQEAYRAALTYFLNRQERIFGQGRKQPGEKPPKPGAEWVRELKKAFKKHYEETGEFLTEYF